MISVEEVQKAVSCLRDQLNPDDLNALLCKLGVAAQGHDIKVGVGLECVQTSERREQNHTCDPCTLPHLHRET